MGAWRASTILCIGDDPLRLNLRCSFLKADGWRVLSAGGGYEGIIRCGQESVDAVVLDLNSGSESALVTGELKRLQPKLLVIVLFGEQSDVAEDATKQADAVIPKSSNGKELLRALSVLDATY